MFLIAAIMLCFAQILTNSAVASLFIPILIVISQEVSNIRYQSAWNLVPKILLNLNLSLLKRVICDSIEVYQSTPSLPAGSIHLFIFIYASVYYCSKRHRLWSSWNENNRHDKSRLADEYHHDIDYDWMYQYIWSSSFWLIDLPWVGHIWGKWSMSQRQCNVSTIEK